MSLSKAEEQLMEFIWKHEKVFLKEIMEQHPDPKPAATTVATLLKRMQDKGYIGYALLGNSRQYFPLVAKTDYFSKHVKGIISNYFDGSALQFASFFTQHSDLTDAELKDLKKIIEQEIKRNKK